MTPFHARAKEAAEEYANSHGTLIGGAQFFDSTTYETFLAGAAFGRSAGLSEAAEVVEAYPGDARDLYHDVDRAICNSADQIAANIRALVQTEEKP